MDKKEWLKIEYMFARCKGTISVVKEEICPNREEYIRLRLEVKGTIQHERVCSVAFYPVIV